MSETDLKSIESVLDGESSWPPGDLLGWCAKTITELVAEVRRLSDPIQRKPYSEVCGEHRP